MCTRVFLSNNSVAKVVSRTLDFSQIGDPYLWWLPAGLDCDAGSSAPGLRWTSKYATVTIHDIGACLDGMNSAGLGAHLHMYTAAAYEPVDGRPVISSGQWARFALDNFATVAEAVDGLSGIRVEPTLYDGMEIGTHLGLEDATGDSAIFEPVNGRMVVTHNRELRVMTNAPSMAEQRVNLLRYHPFGGELPPPGDITSADRFVRASYFLHYLPEPEDARMAVAGAMQVTSTCAKPLGAPYPSGEVYPTRWISAADLTNLDFYFWSRTSPSVVSVSMDDFSLAVEPRCLALGLSGLAGDVADKMSPAQLGY